MSKSPAVINQAEMQEKEIREAKIAASDLGELNGLQLYYGGVKDRINAQTLVGSLIEITKLVQEVNKEIAPDKKIEVDVTAIGEGSFILTIDLVEAIADATKFVFEHSTQIGGVIGSVVGLMKLAKHLKGEKPEKAKEISGNNIEVKNNDGQILVTDNRTYNIFLENPNVPKILGRHYAALAEDTDIDNFKILKKTDKKSDEPLFEAKKEEFPLMSVVAMPPLAVENSRTANINGATVSAVKIVFERGRKWEFMYNGRKISAYVSDDSFFTDMIDKGEPFSKGDRLIVDMEVSQEYDAKLDGYIDGEYRIVKVREHIPRDKQMGLNE